MNHLNLTFALFISQQIKYCSNAFKYNEIVLLSCKSPEKTTYTKCCIHIRCCSVRAIDQLLIVCHSSSVILHIYVRVYFCFFFFFQFKLIYHVPLLCVSILHAGVVPGVFTAAVTVIRLYITDIINALSFCCIRLHNQSTGSCWELLIILPSFRHEISMSSQSITNMLFCIQVHSLQRCSTGAS